MGGWVREHSEMQSRHFGDEGGGAIANLEENQKIRVRVTTGGGIAPRERHGDE